MSQRKMILSASAAVGQEVHQADLVDGAEDLVLAGLAQVAVHQQHLLAELRQDHREVGGGRGLAFGRHRRGDDDHFELPRRGEEQGGAKVAVGLGHRETRAQMRQELDLHLAVGRAPAHLAALFTALVALATVGAFCP